jgi:hypothetical protein
MKHCCALMNSWAEVEEDLLEYDLAAKSYNFVLDEKYYPGGKRIGLNYCTWCGTKLID